MIRFKNFLRELFNQQKPNKMSDEKEISNVEENEVDNTSENLPTKDVCTEKEESSFVTPTRGRIVDLHLSKQDLIDFAEVRNGSEIVSAIITDVFENDKHQVNLTPFFTGAGKENTRFYSISHADRVESITDNTSFWSYPTRK